MEFFASYRARVRGRQDSEHTQALIRLLIVGLVIANTAIIDAGAEQVARMWITGLGSAVFSVLLFARVLARPHVSSRRRAAGAIHDNLCATVWLYIAGPAGALALFVYPFVTVGNGFRFGVRYLALSGTLGAIGIWYLVAMADGWASHAMIGWGVLLSHLMVTLYTGVLLRRLNQTQEQLKSLATCDPLTGLPNRRFFMDRLSSMIAQDHRDMACLYLDLDGFKAVNDRCGHKVGDQLQHTVARELRGCIRATDVGARLGGDEFTVVLAGPVTREHARDVAVRIINAIGAIRVVDGHAIEISVSIGISFSPGAHIRPVTSDELLKAADEGMYIAKRSGRGRYRFIDFADDAYVSAA